MDQATDPSQGSSTWFDEALASIAAGIRVYNDNRAQQQAAAAGTLSQVGPKAQSAAPWFALAVLGLVVYMVWE